MRGVLATSAPGGCCGTRRIPEGENGSVIARCQRNEELRSGGFEIEPSASEGNAGFVHGSRRSGDRGWEVLGFATDGTPELTAYAYCRKEVRPNVVQLHQAGSGLHAFPCRIDTLSFATKYQGRRASAPGKLTNLRDTNLHHPKCQRGWRPTRKKVGRLVRESLNERGVAVVRTRARRGSRVDTHRWRIVLARCAPPSGVFPADCEVIRSGKHI